MPAPVVDYRLSQFESSKIAMTFSLLSMLLLVATRLTDAVVGRNQ